MVNKDKYIKLHVTGVCLHVDMTAWVSIFLLCSLLTLAAETLSGKVSNQFVSTGTIETLTGSTRNQSSVVMAMRHEWKIAAAWQ